jgi:hypothetical protein
MDISLQSRHASAKHIGDGYLQTFPKQPVAVGWYDLENWTKVKAQASDPDRFENSYQDWTDMAEKALKDLIAAGIIVDRFFIKSKDLLAWCLVHDKQNNAAARAEFVSQMFSHQRAHGS